MSEEGASFYRIKIVTDVFDYLFPDRELYLRTDGNVRFYKVSQRTQIAALVFVLLSTSWASYTSYGYVRHSEILIQKEQEVSRAQFEKEQEVNKAGLAYQNLLDEVAVYQQRFTSLTKDLEVSYSMMLGLVEKNASLQYNLRSVSKELVVTESERERVSSNRIKLKKELSDIEVLMKNEIASIESRMDGVLNHNLTLTNDLEFVEDNLQSALKERNQALFEGTRMSRQIKNLEGRLSTLQFNQEGSVQRLTERTSSYIENIEEVIEKAGLDVNKVLKSIQGSAADQGGPFFPIKLDGLPADRLKARLNKLDYQLERWEAIQILMKKIPLSSPLNSYYITSKYGKRLDPVNKRWSSHYGLDMGGVRKSNIYAPAPGIVTFAGRKGNYGNLVIIDHGAGVKTKYGHLNKFYVKKGQKIKFRERIALLGNTGRSTGPHLHYEISFNGKTMDPYKFIKAGQHVFKE